MTEPNGVPRIAEEEQHPTDLPDEGGESFTSELAEITGGVTTNDVEELGTAVALAKALYRPLRMMAGRSPAEMAVRITVLLCLMRDPQAVYTPERIAQRLAWLPEVKRLGVIGKLREAGLLGSSGRSSYVTGDGLKAHGLFTFANRDLGEIKAILIDIESASMAGLNPVAHLNSLLTELRRYIATADEALRRHSRSDLLESSRTLKEVLLLAVDIRRTIDRISVHDTTTRSKVREVHGDLSRLLTVEADLEAATIEAVRQTWGLPIALRPDELIRALSILGKDELLTLARRAMMPYPFAPVFYPFMDTLSTCTKTDNYVIRRQLGGPVLFTDVEKPRKEATVSGGGEARRFVEELRALASSGRPADLEDVLVAATKENSFFRGNLVTVVGKGLQGARGIVRDVAAVPIDIEVDNPSVKDLPPGGPIARISRGRLQPRRHPDE